MEFGEAQSVDWVVIKLCAVPFIFADAGQRFGFFYDRYPFDLLVVKVRFF